MADSDDRELDDAIHAEVERLSEEGNDALDAGQHDAAIAAFSRAYELLPEPRMGWEAAMWLQASMGDAYYEQKDYARALEHFSTARNSGSGVGNPFVLLRLGECHYETGDLVEAKRYLLEAYMVEGAEIFLQEDSRYLDLIIEHVER